jgi:hypothetical protein
VDYGDWTGMGLGHAHRRDASAQEFDAFLTL